MPKPCHQSHETLDELWVTNKISYAFVTHVKSLQLIKHILVRRDLYNKITKTQFTNELSLTSVIKLNLTLFKITIFH